MKKEKINWPYCLGLLETDGSFYIIFKADPRMPIKYRIHPEIEWSQKNRQVLSSIEEYLSICGIKSKEKYTPADVRAGRAPRLKISGIGECRKFFQHMEKQKSAILYGNKKMDALLMEQVWKIVEQGLHNTPQGRKKILDLKLALHIPSPALHTLDHPVFHNSVPKVKAVKGSALSRKEWEKKHGFSASRGSANEEIALAREKYMEFARGVLENPPPCAGDYISALLDGNGYIYTPTKKTQSSVISLEMERGGELALFSLIHYFGDGKPCVHKKKSSTSYTLARRELLSAFKAHVSIHPILFKGAAVEKFLRRCSEKKKKRN